MALIDEARMVMPQPVGIKSEALDSCFCRNDEREQLVHRFRGDDGAKVNNGLP